MADCGGEQDLLQQLPIIHDRIGDRILTNQFVFLVDVDMVLVPIVTDVIYWIETAQLRDYVLN